MKPQIAIRITWSKVMAFVMLACAVFLDVRNNGATAFMFAVPFVSALIVGKQYFDRNVKPNETTG